jgi:hypothetical protein
MSYKYAEDGKIHTRWSDLKRCSTSHGALTVAKEMVLGQKRWSGDDFGSKRHSMWEKESLQTGRTPECFRHIKIDYVAEAPESQYSMEILPGVILHSTIDVYLPEIACVTDYKTFTNAADLKSYKQPHKTAQLLTYSLQLLNVGKPVKNVMFLGERWDGERDVLLGYDHVMMPVSTIDLVKMRADLKARAVRLSAAIQVLRDSREVLDIVP